MVNIAMLLVTFIDETESLANNHDYDSESDNGDPFPEPGPEDTPISTSTSQFTHDETSHSPFGNQQNQKSDASGAGLPRTVLSWDHPSPPILEPHHQVSLPRLPGLPHHDFLRLPSSVPSGPSSLLNNDTSSHNLTADRNSFRENPTPISLPSIYLSKPVWPLTDPSEARLLRHFVQNLAIWVSTVPPSVFH